MYGKEDVPEVEGVRSPRTEENTFYSSSRLIITVWFTRTRALPCVGYEREHCCGGRLQGQILEGGEFGTLQKAQ